MHLLINTLSKKIVIINVEGCDTILHVKEKIQNAENIPIDQQRLIFAGIQLENSKIINDYKIKDGSNIHLVLCLRGGMHHVTSARNDYDIILIIHYELTNIYVPIKYTETIFDVKLLLKAERYNFAKQVTNCDMIKWLDDPTSYILYHNKIKMNDTDNIKNLNIMDKTVIQFFPIEN